MAIKVLAIIQARMGSTRLSGKVLKKINGRPLIEILFQRISQSNKIDKIILATSNNAENDCLVETVGKMGFDVFRGSEENVLERYYQAADLYNPKTIVRITGDCPLIDPQLTDKVIDLFQKSNVDYACNTQPPTFPDGLDTEVFSFSALQAAQQQATKSFDLEHVTPFIRTNEQFRRKNYANKTDQSKKRWTVDDPEDFLVIKNIVKHFSPNLDFTWKAVMELQESKPEYFEANISIKRNEGSEFGTGQKLWKRAKKVIPGGNMLLSKRAEMFLPEKWPAYYEKSKGCTVWDLDGNKYIDMSIMGIGTNVLGYANDEVDHEVRKTIDKSNTSTLNCPEEVYLAEKLVELHPWSDMVRFARSGGEATAIAIRIARAASGKDKVAFCGYHGWHDWYLSANLSSVENLEGHLLPGLEPKGVPGVLSGSSVPFNYNDFDSLQKIVDKDDIGVIMMEVSRNSEPKNNFLQNIRALATKKGIVLIFDEITSGFRVKLGGSHLQYGVNPDMAVFGKAMGNGYAISAVIGKRNIMEYAQSSFISSTFWTERTGPVAALKTIEILERDSIPERLIETGNYVNKCWSELAESHGLHINIYGIQAITHFGFNSDQELAIKTYITQEMLKKGYLAGNSVYICIDHSKEVIDDYINELEKPFGKISDIIKSGTIDSFLDTPKCHSGFMRLN
jgi:glutamate-1-semialdehyde 2,1-aminomutase